jgi:hypothetical protein
VTLAGLALATAVSAALTQGSASREEQIAALVQRARPQDDDWTCERLEARARPALEALCAAIAGGGGRGLEEAFAPDARVVLAGALGPAIPTPGGVLIARGSPESERRELAPAEGLADLVELFGSAKDAHFEAEVDRVVDLGGGRFREEARVRFWGARSSVRIQRSEDWSLEWSKEEGALRLTALERSAPEEARAPAPLFEDCTAAVLGTEGARREELLRGGAEWSRRLDDLGESAFMGQNGLAVGDVDGDGLEDLYVAMGTGLPNQLWVQREDGTARECAREAGVDWLDDTKGALLVDLDGDGDRDLVCAIGPTLLVCTNEFKGGKGLFKPSRSLRAPSDAAFYSIAAADYDLDGDLDLYACRYVEASYGESIPAPFQDARNGPSNHLLRNDGRQGFRDVTALVGLDLNNDRFSTAAAWCDVDLDGDPDLYVTNDFGLNNLYRNDGGRFVDVAVEAGVADAAAGMGASFADFDGDGDFDLYVSNMDSAAGRRVSAEARFQAGQPAALRELVGRHAMGNALFENLGEGSFADRGAELGVRRGGWSWGSLLADVDGDGWHDVIAPNGFLSGPRGGDLSSFFWRHVAARSPEARELTPEYENGWIAITRLMDSGISWAGDQRNRLWLRAGEGAFADISGLSGLDFPDDARALAALDWDGDGRLDLWVKNRSAPQLRFLHNRCAAGAGSISIRLVGKTCNRDAVGAVVVLESAGRRLVRAVSAGDGYLAQSSAWLHFGLPEGAAIERATVAWPGGAREELLGLEAGGRFVVEQGSGRAQAAPRRTVRFAPGALQPLPERSDARIVLRTAFPLPPALLAELRSDVEPAAPKALVIATAEAPDGFPPDEVQLLEAAGAEVRVLEPGDGRRAVLEALYDHALFGSAEFPARAVFLVDRLGFLQIVYAGPVDAEPLARDVELYGLHPERSPPRAAFGGRWFFGMPRNLPALAAALERRGRRGEAAFYRELALEQGRGR